jgi:steroid 5-alpha reductase family enzyme
MSAASSPFGNSAARTAAFSMRLGVFCSAASAAASRSTWLGYAIYGLAFWPYGTIALAGQAIILSSILGVTGIPPTEMQAIRSKGDAYRAYQRRVSRFVPLPPKRDA